MSAAFRGVSIRRIEYSLPRRLVTNEELARRNPDWDMGLVASKTGVMSRGVSEDDELASDLAHAATLRLLASAGVPKDDIGAIVYCTQSPDYIMPPNSTLLHGRLGLPKSVAAFDFTLACSGYVYGLALGGSLMTALPYRKILLVTADTYSRYIHPRDRSASTLFGDGAAATLLEATDGPSRIIDVELGTDGQGGPSFMIKAGGARLPRSPTTCVARRDISGNERSEENVQMDGRAVLDFAAREVPPCIEAILRRNGISLDQVDLVLFHQASAFALQALTKMLGVPPHRTFSNIANVGNTVSASIPILLKDAEDAGALRRGQLVLLVGFGVGFSWGCCLLRW